ncbi:MAG: hypothetical protein ACU84J_01910 [Gammaproteobacteria bacterium]
MSRVAVDDVLMEEFDDELKKLERCITRAWTEIDEALHRMSHATLFFVRIHKH